MIKLHSKKSDIPLNQSLFCVAINEKINEKGEGQFDILPWFPEEHFPPEDRCLALFQYRIIYLLAQKLVGDDRIDPVLKPALSLFLGNASNHLDPQKTGVELISTRLDEIYA